MSDFDHALDVVQDPDPDLDVEAWAQDRPRGSAGGVVSEHDVAIDFPSVSKFPARMQALFFGRDRGVGLPEVGHTADVELTWREARGGARVLIDLPIRHSCPVCGGRGETWSDPCGACTGTGAGTMSHRLRFRVPARVQNGARLLYTVALPFAGETRVELRIAVR